MTARSFARRATPWTALLAVGALAWAGAGPTAGLAQDAPRPALRPTHELLNATLWVQQSAEWRALGYQAYGAGQAQFVRAQADPSWTAAEEQEGQAGIGELPLAVILDVDETVLDNSAYEARLIEDGGAYGPATWDAWCKEEAAPAIPGALEFCKFVHAQGATVFYVTNRKDHLREATRNNLRKAGFPLREGVEVVRTRGAEKDKTGRRREIAQGYRVVLLVGDNGSDFSSKLLAETNEATRGAADARRAWWGERWILLANPMYGHWEENAVQRKWGDENDHERLRLRKAALRPQR